MCVHFAFKGQWHHKALNNVQGFLFAVRRPYHPPSAPLALRLPTRMRSVNEAYSNVVDEGVEPYGRHNLNHTDHV